jgi:hypothetical protein
LRKSEVSLHPRSRQKTKARLGRQGEGGEEKNS